MKRTILGLITAMAMGTAAAAQDVPDLVTIVATGEPQTQLMSMVLSMQAMQQGSEVHILLCGPAGDLALQDAPGAATAGQPPRDMSPQGLMQMIQAKTGATIEVCAIYLPGRGDDQSVLLEGVGVADPAEMAARLMAPDARVLSF